MSRAEGATRLRLAAVFLMIVSLCTVGCRAQNSSMKLYTSCKLGPDFQIVQVDGPSNDFAWPTPVKSGKVNIPVETGYRVLVAYQETEPFGNLKVERLPKSEFFDAKANILSSLQFLSSETGMEHQVQTETKNGLTVYGVTRDKVEGGVLSNYAVFLDDQDIAVTMYLLNAEPEQRKFNTLTEYKHIRDRFLDAYTKCVAAGAKPH
jgi:hypothetical protein